jgi:iron complex transport system substrate-binding protein
MRMNFRYMIWVLTALMAVSCLQAPSDGQAGNGMYAHYFEIPEGESGAVVIISPADGARDTLRFDEPMDNIICMSSSHVACLSAIGAGDAISAVSGLRFISGSLVHDGGVYDIGYENSLDYERIMSLDPDLVVTYTVSGALPQYISKLRSLGVPVAIIHDHLETHPLARAEYVRLFGALTGRVDEADSLFAVVRRRYEALACSVGPKAHVNVLLNIPYGDVWYVPGKSGYMSRMINDAGGDVLGAKEGSASSVISLEHAYRLSKKADIWLNPGHCRTREGLSRIHQLFPSFGPLADGHPIYNNIARVNPEGGNDFWESGAVRPDLILEDLIAIFNGTADSLHYYIPVE